ncbi:aminotransferase class IV [Bacteriovoracaceae bacterium]|nr:aminotransferase class IV [Bacteriovoracaceae bacterium]
MKNEIFNEKIKGFIVNINGQLTSGDKAKISIFDRGLLFGDSIYEVTSTINRKILFFTEHLNRLFNSADLISLPLNFSNDEIVQESIKTLEKLNCDNAYIRIIITRGLSFPSIDPTQFIANNLIIICMPSLNEPTFWQEEGIKVIIGNTIRNHKRSIDPNAKSGNYLNNIMALSEAKRRGFSDTIMCNSDGVITEGTTNNIWLIKNGVYKTPSLDSGLLKGITREKILTILKKKNLPIQETKITPEELINSEECFISSSTRGIVPITQINDKIIGDGTAGKKTKLLFDYYQEFLLQEMDKTPYSF